MSPACLVDFDNTLLNIDSLRYLLRAERLWLRWGVLWRGGLVWLAGWLLPRSWQRPFRRSLKYRMLKILVERGMGPVIARHAPVLAGSLNERLMSWLQERYQRVVVVTASWQPLVQAVLVERGVNWEVRGALYTPVESEFKTFWYTDKLRVLPELNINQFDLYTDSADDRPLMALANQVTIVRAGGQLLEGASQDGVILSSPKVLGWLLIIALAVRLAGIRFGLPLWVVGDEPALIFGTLKMLELKTLLPSLHVADFGGTFYYGPYLPYIYLLPFSIAAVLRWLFFTGSLAEFKTWLQADPSVFFLVARFISALFGTATVWLLYRAVREWLRSERAAFMAATLLAFSWFHVNFSHWARHWVPVVALFTLVIYVLARSDWSPTTRYTRALLLTALGAGISVQSLLILGWIGLWAWLVERIAWRQFLATAWLWRAVGGVIGLLLLAFIIWPNSFGFLLSHPPASAGTLGRLVFELPRIYWPHVLNLATAEPLVFFFFLWGSGVWWWRQRRAIISVWLFSGGYLVLAYLMFGVVGRYLLLIYPLLMVVAGVGLEWWYKQVAVRGALATWLFMILVAVSLIVPIIKMDYLLVKSDTRSQAAQWVQRNLPLSAKVATIAPQLRLPTTPVALREQFSLDSSSLRTVDRAEAALGDQAGARQHILNTYNIVNSGFFADFPNYLRFRQYTHIVVDAQFAKERGTVFPDDFGDTIKFFPGSWSIAKRLNTQRLPDGFGDGLREIFYSTSLGPDLAVIKIR